MTRTRREYCMRRGKEMETYRIERKIDREREMV